jgi:hypothetical protein
VQRAAECVPARARRRRRRLSPAQHRQARSIATTRHPAPPRATDAARTLPTRLGRGLAVGGAPVYRACHRTPRRATARAARAGQSTVRTARWAAGDRGATGGRQSRQRSHRSTVTPHTADLGHGRFRRSRANPRRKNVQSAALPLCGPAASHGDAHRGPGGAAGGGALGRRRHALPPSPAWGLWRGGRRGAGVSRDAGTPQRAAPLPRPSRAHSTRAAPRPSHEWTRHKRPVSYAVHMCARADPVHTRARRRRADGAAAAWRGLVAAGCDSRRGPECGGRNFVPHIQRRGGAATALRVVLDASSLFVVC